LSAPKERRVPRELQIKSCLLNCRFISLPGLRTHYRAYASTSSRSDSSLLHPVIKSQRPIAGIRPQQVVRPRWPQADSLGVLLQLNLPVDGVAYDPAKHNALQAILARQDAQAAGPAPQEDQ
jgi:hypothetical protein